MAYDKLVEDNRVFDAADGNDVVPEDHNEFQDQVKGMVKARKMSCPLSSGYAQTAAGWTLATIPGQWQETNLTANSLLYIPAPPLRVGEKITAAGVYVLGQVGPVGGVIDLVKIADDTTTITQVSDLTNGQAHPWANATAQTLYNYLAASVTVADKESFFFRLQNASANMANIYVRGAYVTTQFGN